MSSSKLKAILATALILGATGITSAHHTYVTKYNPSKRVTISDVVTSVSFFNPHVFFSVQSAKGIQHGHSRKLGPLPRPRSI